MHIIVSGNGIFLLRANEPARSKSNSATGLHKQALITKCRGDPRIAPCLSNPPLGRMADPPRIVWLSRTCVICGSNHPRKLRACEIIKTAQIHVNTDYTSSVKGNTCSMQQIQPMPTKMPPSLFPDLPELAQLPIKNPKAHRHDLKAPARVLTPNRLQVDSPQQP